LVELLELPWRAAPTNVDEDDHLLTDPLVGALNVALAKARAPRPSSREIVLAADTLVVSEAQVLGKPQNAQHATEMLRALGGRPHDVITGVALRAASGREWGAAVSSRVHMRGYSDGEIEAYVARGEPFDKAGAYAIQDAVFRPVERVEGCYLNVVGLPLCAAAAGLEALGVEVSNNRRRAPCAYCSAGSALVTIQAAQDTERSVS
jgi:septum formation protein